MSRMQSVVRRPHRLIAGAVAAATLGSIGLVAVEPAANAANPTGSIVEMFTEAGAPTYDPANRINGSGFWGHEGPNHDQGTYISSDLSAGEAAWLAKWEGVSDSSSFAVAFVPKSADGSAERPVVTAGESIGDAYDYFTVDGNNGMGGWTGSANPALDQVMVVSTLAEHEAWVADGGPAQIASSDDLVMHDALRPGVPVSAHPRGKSILNRWAAGQEMSLVFVQIDGTQGGLPIVHRGADGRAVAAWFNFTTQVDPEVGDAGHAGVATSGGYLITSALEAPDLSLGTTWSGTTATVTATLKGTGGATLTDATGTVQFSAKPKNNPTGSFTLVGSPVPVTASGTASYDVTGLVPGDAQQFQAVYTPDTAGATKYTAATSNNRTVTSSKAVLAVTGTLKAGYKQTLTAAITPIGATGTVTFFDGTTALGSAPVSASTGKAVATLALKVGARSLSATFAPSSAGYNAATSATVARTIAKATPTVTAVRTPTTVRKGVRAKLVITVKATGLVPTGTVTVTWDPATGATKTLKGTLRAGKVTITLPAAVKGRTVVKVKYSGSSTVATASKALPAYTVR